MHKICKLCNSIHIQHDLIFQFQIFVDELLMARGLHRRFQLFRGLWDFPTKQKHKVYPFIDGEQAKLSWHKERK